MLNAITDEEVLPIYVPKVGSDTRIPENRLMIAELEGRRTFSGSVGRLFFSHEGLGSVKMQFLIRTRNEATQTNDRRRIIDQNISTSLILESDADWDMRVRESLTLIAKGVNWVMDYPFFIDDHHQARSSPSSPYGDRWDVLWLGHCGGLGPYQGRVYPLDDPVAPPPRFEYAIVAIDSPDPYPRPDRLRIVHEVRYNLCTYAYAVSLEGARKLRRLGTTSSEPWDLRLTEICRDTPAVRCASVSPQLFTAAYSDPNIHDSDGLRLSPPSTNPDNDRLGPRPGPGIQLSARRNSRLGREAPRSSWIWEW